MILAAANVPSSKKTRIWLIGDSTISIKDPKAYPETGWGMPFVNYWDSTVEVVNLAMNGRSTRTFMEEKRWEPVMAGLQEGDYVFIQFGHNDENPEKKTYVNEDGYRKFLELYVSDTRSKKGIPVLITPVSRRKFDSTGTINETHRVYSAIVREVAAREKVVLIDLDAESRALFNKLGKEASTHLFLHLQPGEHPNYPEGKTDDTHFSELGALKVSGLILENIRRQIPSLAARITKPVK